MTEPKSIHEAAQDLGAIVYENKTRLITALEEHAAVCDAIGTNSARLRQMIAELEAGIADYRAALAVFVRGSENRPA